MLKSLQKEKTGNRKACRKQLEQSFDNFLGQLGKDAQAEIENLRREILEVRQKALPLTTKYSTTNERTWLREEPVRIRTEALRAAGFQESGCFLSAASPSSLRVAFIHERQKCMATVIKVGARVFLSIGYDHTDGSMDEFSDYPESKSRGFPPWQRIVNRPDLNPYELIRLAQKKHRKGRLKSPTADDYAPGGEDGWFRTVSWLAEVGGHSAAYLKEAYRLTDSTEDREKLEWLRRDEADRSLCNWLRLQPNLPFKVDDVLGQLVIIHDDLTPPLLTTAWLCGTNDIRATDDDFAGSNPRKAFAESNRKRGDKLRLAFKKRTGFPADYYLSSAD